MGMAIRHNSVNENTAGYFYLIVNKNQLLFFEGTHQRTYFDSYYFILIGYTLYISRRLKKQELLWMEL